MKKIIFTVLIILTASFVYGWSSVGFKIEDHEFIKEYKLPAWGYSTSSLDFSGRGNFRRRDTAYKRMNEDYSFNFMPDYVRTFNSEDKSYDLSVRVNNYVGYYHDQDEEYDRDEIARIYEIFPIINGNYNFYISDDLFLNSSISMLFNYSEINNSNDVHDRIQRRMDSSSFLGIGFGRVRDVSPIFRALRLKERLEALNRGMTLTDKQIEELANTFSQYYKFARVYDRYEKYFWEEISPILNDEFSALNISESLYLTEVMQEYIKRLQGSEVILGIDLWQRYFSERDEDILDDVYAGPGISFNYYNNFNLKYQLSIFSKLSYGKYLKDDSIEDSNLIFEFSNRHLFDLSDRLRWSSGIAFSYDHYWYDDVDGYIFDTKIESSIDYFIENNFSFYCKISTDLEYIDEKLYELEDHGYYFPDFKREERASIYFGCRYYFSNIF
jgi:hypothetical protein